MYNKMEEAKSELADAKIVKKFMLLIFFKKIFSQESSRISKACESRRNDPLPV